MRNVVIMLLAVAFSLAASPAPDGWSVAPVFTLESAHEGDDFGAVLAVGDVDGDGAPDIAVGAPGDSAAGDGAGAVYIYSGRTRELLRELHGSQPGEQFGQSVALTYLEKDSMSDLIVGAPGWKDGAGAVYLATRPTKDDPPAPVRIAEGKRPGDRLGWSVAAVPAVPGADVTGILAGEPGHDEAGRDDAGRAVLLRVKNAKAKKLKVEVVREWVGDSLGARLGEFVRLAGDANFDSTLDAYVGEPGGSDAEGRATGALRLVNGANGKVLQRFTGRSEGDDFGSCAATVNVHGKGVQDQEVLVGARGYAQLFSSKDGKLRKTFEADAPGHEFGMVVGGSFRMESEYQWGFAIATACAEAPGAGVPPAFHGVRIYSGETLEEVARLPADGGRLGLALEHAVFAAQAHEALVIGESRLERGRVRVVELRSSK
jgi:hypothetical protein